MPWNQDDDGKPKPTGDRGPWGGPGGNRNNGSGNRPPDLDELINKGRDQLKSLLPNGGKVGWLIPLAAFAAFWAYNSIYQVQPDERGMVLRLGAYNRTVAPGLHFAAWPVDRMEVLPVAAENQTSLGDTGDEGMMLTGDQNLLDIKFKVLWKIADPQKFLFNVSEQQRMVQTVSESAMREIIGRTPATEALTTGRLLIQNQVTEIIQRTLDEYNAGVQITGLAFEGVPPPQVQDAFEDVQRAQQDQQRSINGAEQYAKQKTRNAEGDAAKRVEDAKGYAAQMTATAKGEAQRFDQIYTEYAKAKDVTRTRLYLETMEKVLAASNKVILEPGKSGSGVVPYLPLPAITQGSANQ